MKEIAKGMFIERRRFQCMYGICGGIIWPLTNVNIEECKCKHSQCFQEIKKNKWNMF